jgi:hypothetical protein
MNPLEKETLDFDIASDGEGGYTIRLRGSIFEGIEYRYTHFSLDERGGKVNIYFDYEIVKNPRGMPLTVELRNFVSFITHRLVKSRLVKVVDEKDRDNHT